MSLIINHWAGEGWRLGLANNILQIIRAIHYGKIKNYSHILFNKHYAFKNTCIKLEKSNPHPSQDINNNFFNIKKLGLTDPEPKIMKLYFQKYISSVLKFKINFIEDRTDVLHIHIRSGDIFGRNPHSYYIQPPLQYYLNIINSKTWKKIIVVYEDNNNPCVKGLMNGNISNIHFQSSSINNDIQELCKSVNLVIGFGTFGYMIYLMNKNLKNLYLPKYVLKELPIGEWDVKLNVIDLPSYIKCGEWKNTEEQRQFMLSYK